MWCAVRDYEMEQLEAELEASRFGKWDVETLLADRHRAKIEALTNKESRWIPVFQAFKELGQFILMWVGAMAIAAMIGHWILTGQFLPG